MSGSPAFQHYVKQWLGDDKVMSMDWDARGVHFHLMNVAWQQEPRCSIPGDETSILKWLPGLGKKAWERIWPQVREAWELRDGRYFQKGLERSLKKQKTYADSNSKNAIIKHEKEARLKVA